ncbi:MAG: DUF935 domain-containing protein [Muribaculaceae bacterium]|nr:DUF935 domain-containing protein [Muribaculaceae bacterium]
MTKKSKHSSSGLAKYKDRRAAASVITELIRTNDYLAKNDISNWRNAWQAAIDVRNPNRQKLYDIYRDSMVDAHLSGCIQQRVGFVMSRSFKLVDTEGNNIDAAIHYLDQDWFKQLCRLALDSIWFGHSLIQLGEVVTDGDGHPSLANVMLIPRKHVIPEYGRVVPRVGMPWRAGYEFRDSQYSDSLIEVGEPDNLGLLLKAALHTIPKKHALSFWDSFAEIFGMPMRIARTTTRDPKEFKRIEDMIYDGASNLAMVTGMDTEIQFVESGKGDAFNVYDRRIDRANSELSKLIIGQTMTIEDGSSLSQSQTHLQVFENLVEADRDMLRDMVNNQLIPKLVNLNFPLQGLRFEWDYAVDYSPEQQLAYESMIADRYEVDPSYFADKYNMPVGAHRQQSSVPENEEDGEEETKGKNSHPFFD